MKLAWPRIPFVVLVAVVFISAFAPQPAWGVCVVRVVSTVTPDPAGSPGTNQITPTVAAAGGLNVSQEGLTERVADVLINDDGVAPNCFALSNFFRLQYSAVLRNPASFSTATLQNFDVYDSAGVGGMAINADSNQAAPAFTTAIGITVVAAGTPGNITTSATGSAIRIKNLRFDATSLAAGAFVTVTVSGPPNALTTATLNVGAVLKTASGATLAAGSGTQSSGAAITNASFTFNENFNNAFRVAGGSCQAGGTTCRSGVAQDIATTATSLILDAGTSIPSGVTVTFPATISTSAIPAIGHAGVIFTSRTGAVTCSGPAPCSVLYDTTANDNLGTFSLGVEGAAVALGAPTTAVNPKVGIVIGATSGAGTATLHASLGPAVSAGSGADDVNASAVPRYLANNAAGAPSRNLFSGPWFTVVNPIPTNPVLAYLPHVPYGSGFRTKITLVNASGNANSGVVNFISQTGQLVASQNWSAAKGGAVRIDTDSVFANSTFGPLAVNWVIIGAAQGPIAANLFYEFNPGSSATPFNVTNSVGFNDAALQTDFTVPFEQEPQPQGAQAGRTVGMAIGNPNSTAATVTVELVDATGTTRGSDNLNVPAFGQIAFALPDVNRLPTVSSGLPNGNFVGTLAIHSSASVAVIALQDSYGPFSATPTMPFRVH